MSKLVRCHWCNQSRRVEPLRYEIHGDPWDRYCTNIDCARSREAAICHRWWDRWGDNWCRIAHELTSVRA